MTETTKTCNCVGPEKCEDLDCIIVRNYRTAAVRAEDRIKEAIEKILDQFVDELEGACTPDDNECQDLEDSIVGEYENILLLGLPPTTDYPIPQPWYPYPGWTSTSGYIQTDPCAACGNNSKNGGSGICVCSIPYMSRTICSTNGGDAG